MKKIVAFAIAASLSTTLFAAPETYVLEKNHILLDRLRQKRAERR